MTKRKALTEQVIRLVMKAPEKPQDLVIYAQLVHDKMAENVATFPAPDPPLAALQSLIDELRAACSYAKTGGIGSPGKRDLVARKVRAALNSELGCVTKVAALDPANAAVIAERAAMSLRGSSFRNKPTLELRHGPVSGCILAIAAAIAKASMYKWQYRLSGGPWLDLPPTGGAGTKLEGLTPTATIQVRFSAVLRTSDVQTDWCDPVSIIVI